MDLYKLTYEEIESLKGKCDMKQVEYDTLVKQSAGELWTLDIDRFIEKWNSDLKEYNKLHSVTKTRKRLKLKKSK